MNVREMNIYARSIVRDQQLLGAHFLRWINLAYREIAREYVIPRLKNGEPVTLVAVSGSTQQYYLPYDFSRVISFFDSNGRSLDPLRSEDVRQYGEYNTLGTFVAFYEYSGVNQTPLLQSGVAPNTISITNRGTTVTASAAVFLDAHVGEWLLPLDRNTAATPSNPEDYAYKIASKTSTTVVELTLPFRGVLSDAGVVGNLATSYFEVRPRGTPIMKIWGDPGAAATVKTEYQRIPSKLANNEDIPEDPRLSEAIVHRAIEMAGWSYKEGYNVKKAQQAVMTSLAAYQTTKDFDKLLIHNFVQSNPNGRSHSMLGGRHMGSWNSFESSGIRY